MADVRLYTDFVLVLDDFDPAAGSYTIQLLPGKSWGEPAKVPVELKFDEIEPLLDNLEADNTTGPEVVGLGMALADRLLPGKLRAAFLQAVNDCGPNEGLRLRLQIRSTRLQQIPWEYCWVETQQAKDPRSNFIVVSPKISLVRHPVLSEPVPPLELGKRKSLRLLATMANPRTPGVELLNLSKEKRLLERVFRPIKMVTWEPILDNIDEATLDSGLAQKPELFHFSGHGKFLEEEQEGSLVLVEDASSARREPAYLQAGILAKKLSLGGVRLAYLGACESSRVGGVSPWTGIAPALIAGGVPAVVAMQYRVDDDMATVFSRAFYTNLLDGLTVDEAITAGRIAVFSQSGEDGVQWGVPTLYLRAENGVLFSDLAERRAESQRGIDRQALLDYLNNLHNENLDNNQEINARLRPLYDQTFFVRRFGQVAAVPLKLDALIDSILDNPDMGGRARSVVLLAENGVGKTPALRGLFYRSVERALAQLGEKGAASALSVPIFLSLSDLRGDLLPLVVNSYRNCGDPNVTAEEVNSLLNRYNCLLFMDALDEMPTSDTLGGIEILRQFAAGHPKVRFVYTCRTMNYHGQLGRAEVMEIDLLTSEQIRTVLGETAYNALPDSLKLLARYRSMLEKILELEGDQQSRISSKGQLVQHLVRARTGLDGQGARKSAIPLAAVESLLEYLAFEMQQAHAPSFSDRQVMEVIIRHLDEWHEAFTWRLAADALEDFDTVKRSERRQWVFTDRSTQAYFAASAIAQNPDLLAPLLDEISDYAWRDTLDILVGIIDNPSGLLFELADRDPLLAAHCYSLARPPLDKRVPKTLLDTLIDHLDHETSDGRSAIASYLSQNPLPNSKPALLDAVRREGRSGVILTLVRALLPLVDLPPADPAELQKHLAHFDTAVRIEAEISLWKAHTGIRHQSPTPDAAALAQLGAIEAQLNAILVDPTQPEIAAGVAALLLGLIGSDFARACLLAVWSWSEVRILQGWCVCDGLALIKHPEVENAALRTLEDAGDLQTVWAIYLLGWVGTQRQAVSMLFQALKEKRAAIKVRGYAAESIGRLDPQDGRKKLEERLSLEEDPWVLRKIIQSLGAIGTLDTIPMLEAYQRTGWVQLRKITRGAISDIRRRFEAV